MSLTLEPITSILGSGRLKVHGLRAGLILALLAPLAVSAPGPDSWGDEPPALLHAEGRAGGARFDLAGRWSLMVDPGAVGLTDGWAEDLSAGRIPPGAPGELLHLPVPGPLEALDQTVEYDGVAWLSHRFELLPGDAPAGSRWRLHFEQVNYAVRAWLDGEEIGGHEGSYRAFSWDLAELRAGRHSLVLRVLDPGDMTTDGMSLATTPHAKESWYHNFGGVLGDVGLVRIDRPVARLSWLHVDASQERIRAEVEVVGPPGQGSADVRLTVVLLSPDEGGPEALVTVKAMTVSLEQGAATLSLSASLPDALRWSPETPHLYQARVSVDSEAANPDGVRSFGLRTLALGQDGLLLDGRPRRLHGVLWQPHFVGSGGMLPSDEVLVAELNAIHDAGFDLVRAHVRPAPPAFLDAADRVGLFVLEEPAIGWVDDDPALAARLAAEVDAMLARDHHHPSIVMWGVLNELSGMAYRHGHELAQRLHLADPTRPVLLDSGGFFGRAAYLDAGADDAFQPMLDEHLYPPYPLPPAVREQLATVAAPAGPSFVSEFGTGALLDTQAAWQGFDERALRSAEARLFAGKAAGNARALATAEAWTTTGWVDISRGLQAAAALEMVELLRGNPALDLLCYTQWQAVSNESSAGLLTPWGQRRPALDAVRHSLRPLLVRVEPGRRSGLVGEQLAADLIVVNDTGAPFAAAAEVECVGLTAADGPDRVSLPSRDWPPGVSRVVLPTLRLTETGTALLRPRLVAQGQDADTGSDARVEVLGRPPLPRVLNVLSTGESLPVRLINPLANPELVSFAERQGFDVSAAARPGDSARQVTVICGPESLSDELDLASRLALWRNIQDGGDALVLLSDPLDSPFSRLVAGARGRQQLVDIPVDVGVAAAGGNFMGRVYPLLEAIESDGSAQLTFAARDRGMPTLRPRRVLHAARLDSAPTPRVRLLSPDEGQLTPVAMLVGPLPPGTRPLMLAVGALGNRIGAPVASVPLGRGRIVFVGMPLLERVDGRPDALRDATLAQLVMELSADGLATQRSLGPLRASKGSRALTSSEERALEVGMAAVRSYAGLADRYSLIAGTGERGPQRVSDAVAALHRALLDLADDRPATAREHLLAAFRQCSDQQTRGFLALERRVLEGVAPLRTSSLLTDLLLAHEVIGAWERGVSEWFTGSREVALAWMGRADLALSESGRLP